MDWSPDAVFDFGPRTHRPGLRWRKRKYMLWPHAAWRVVVPKEVERSLNPVERSVLRLHIAGQRRFDDVAKNMGLEPELIAFVVEQLRTKSALDEKGRPTERGLRFLDDSEVDPDDLVVGWVFRDPRSNRLLPRFVTELQLATVEADEKGRPVLVSGSKGRPFRAGAFVVPGEPGGLGAAPSPSEVLDAVRRHRRHVKRAKRSRTEFGVDAPASVHQVSLISSRPDRVHLLTFVYVPESEDEEEPWFVADPFGFGASPQLREQLERLRIETSGSSLGQILDDITGEAMEGRRETWMQMLGLMEEQARADVARVFPDTGVQGQSDVRDRLEKARVDSLRLESARASGSRLLARDIDAVYLRLRQAIEAGIKLVFDHHPTGTSWTKVRNLNWDAVREVVSSCATATGFAGDRLPNPVRRSKAGAIIYSSREGGGNVRPALAALLLHAADQPSHPLRRLAAEDVEWLVRIDGLAARAGGEVHGSPKGLTLEQVKADGDEAAGLLLELLRALVPQRIEGGK